MVYTIFGSWCYSGVERMKISKYTFLPVAISIILFLIPFFWFKPGEMDLGGDSSRLYFYDPASYLSKAALYVISPSSFGAEYIGYYNIPFIFLLLILKSIVISPTILISMFYGLNLSIPFISCYLIIKALIEEKKGWHEAAIAGGLLYVFFPAVMDGWKHVLITYNHIFLSPLIFYLLLKYFKTSNVKYILVTILLTFIFSPNFSVGAAPSIFAFYPLSIVFLMLYTKFILKRHIVVKHIALGFLLFVGIQAFHLFPAISSIFSSGSDISSTIFTDKGKFDRGLSYFSAIAPNIKASLSLLILPQMASLSLFSKVFIVFPFVIVITFLFRKNKTILLTAGFFLIVLFFTTANITNIWLLFYKTLFNIPGFSIFRNFNSQWIYTYAFFYSILFGQALYILLSKLKKTHGFLLISSLILFLIIYEIPLIKGDIVRENLWQSNNIKSVLEMDPDFEEAISFVRSLPAEGRVLTLPLSDPGYQIVAGENGGAYMGPSIIAYLGGKKDFAGYDELLGYKILILKLIRNNELETLKRILGTLNIKYIFYNADPVIYNEFPSFPYQHVRLILPIDQQSYKKLIKNLALKEIKNIDNKFFVFELQDSYYLPQIFTAKKSLHVNNPITEIKAHLSLEEKDNRIALFNYGGILIDPKIKFDEVLVDVRDNSSFSSLIKSMDKPTFGFPFASWKVTSLFYPYIVLREKKVLASYTELDNIHIDRRIFLAQKRIAELEKWGKDTSILGNVKSIDHLGRSWHDPNIWEAILFEKYNYWEISLLRYQRAIYDLIHKIEEESLLDNSFIINKDRVRRSISTDREMLYRIIQYDEKLSGDQKIYLLKLNMDMFQSIIDRLQFEMPPLEKVTYNLDGLDKGKYDLFIDKKSLQYYNRSKVKVVINDKEFSLDDFSQNDEWFNIQKVIEKEKIQKSLTLQIPEPINFILDTKFKSVEVGNFATNSASLTINNIVNEKSGLFREVGNWNSMSYYVVSFDYITYGKGFKFLLFGKARGEDKKISILLEDELRSNKWRTYNALVAPSDDASSAFVQILKPLGNNLLNKIESQGQTTKIDIRNLSIVQVLNPKIILRKTNINDQDKNIPVITFTRINPTKYRLKVQNAIAPYTLVLVNQFNVKWRLVDPTRNTPTIKAFFSRFIASIGKIVMGIRKENAKSSNTQLTYFGGDIRENVNNDIFLNEKTFDTWGKNEIAEYKHFPVNGYSNAWYIEPKDMGGKRSYTIILEMTAQKMLYSSLAISIFILMLTIIVLIKVLLRNK